MSLTRTTRRSGRRLVLLALLGGLFFWLTDPAIGPALRAGAYAWYDPRSWLAAVRGSPASPIDAAHDAAVATMVGLIGCCLVLGVGLWMMTRRRV